MANLGQIYDIDLKLLRCFCTIVEEGSFRAAQSTLNLSQSMMSEYLKSLETRLGVRLCQRGPKGFKLLPEGEVVYEAARDLFAAVERYKQRASQLDDGYGHELSIGIQDQIVDNPHSRVAEAIARFSEYYPNCRFRVEIMLGFQMTGRVADGLLHVGIGILNDQFQGLAAERLFEERSTIYCGSGHPLFPVPDDALTAEAIERAVYCNRGHHEYVHPERTRNSATCGDIGLGAHAQTTLVLSGRNIGTLPDHVAEPHVAAGRLRALRPDLTQRTTAVAAMTGQGVKTFKLVQRFVDCLVDVHTEARAVAAAARHPVDAFDVGQPRRTGDIAERPAEGVRLTRMA